ncbi:MAG TPA: PaaI family thioesterase [Ktedonobacteraceae bacterium]|jgi:1,4-dihydroxy-2-naphthoyl-CoA hydrolase|nr:PaaI family thioesterase [Ktedonobacteraceae bacterium]
MSMEFSSEEFVARINSTRAGSVWESLDIKLVMATREKVVATMPIGPNHRQQLGYLHGGISITLAESLASLGSVLNIDPVHQMAFGLEINASHLRPKRDGVVTGTATLLRRGRTAHVWDVRITDEEEKLICVSRCTIAIVERAPESASPLFANPS